MDAVTEVYLVMVLAHCIDLVDENLVGVLGFPPGMFPRDPVVVARRIHMLEDRAYVSGVFVEPAVFTEGWRESNNFEFCEEWVLR